MIAKDVVVVSKGKYQNVHCKNLPPGGAAWLRSLCQQPSHRKSISGCRTPKLVAARLPGAHSVPLGEQGSSHPVVSSHETTTTAINYRYSYSQSFSVFVVKIIKSDVFVTKNNNSKFDPKYINGNHISSCPGVQTSMVPIARDGIYLCLFSVVQGLE